MEIKDKILEAVYEYRERDMKSSNNKNRQIKERRRRAQAAKKGIDYEKFSLDLDIKIVLRENKEFLEYRNNLVKEKKKAKNAKYFQAIMRDEKKHEKHLENQRKSKETRTGIIVQKKGFYNKKHHYDEDADNRFDFEKAMQSIYYDQKVRCGESVCY